MKLQDKQAILTVQDVLKDIIMGLSNIKLNLPHDAKWEKIGESVNHIVKAKKCLEDVI